MNGKNATQEEISEMERRYNEASMLASKASSVLDDLNAELHWLEDVDGNRAELDDMYAKTGHFVAYMNGMVRSLDRSAEVLFKRSCDGDPERTRAMRERVDEFDDWFCSLSNDDQKYCAEYLSNRVYKSWEERA